jgi:hypothetical protein
VFTRAHLPTNVSEDHDTSIIGKKWRKKQHGPPKHRYPAITPDIVTTQKTSTWNYLTPWRKVHLEKLIVTQLVKKFPAFNGIVSFITVFTKACHWSLPWARCIQSTPTHPTKFDTKNTASWTAGWLWDVRS